MEAPAIERWARRRRSHIRVVRWWWMRSRSLCAFVAGAYLTPARGQSFRLSLAKQVLTGKMDSVIKTIERNIRLI